MTRTHESICNTTLRNLDAFLDSELDERAAAAVQQHLSECIACSSELDLRSNLRSRLRNASVQESPSPYLRTRVLAHLRQHERRSSMWLQRSIWVPAVTAMLVLTLGLSVAYQQGHLRFTAGSQDNYLDAMLQKVALGMRPGLSNHIHCAVFRKYPKQTPGIDTLRADLGPEYQALLGVVKAKLPSDFSVRMAHQCTFRSRTFVHVALKSDSNLMSLVLTRRRPGETLSSNGIAPVITKGGLKLYGESAQRFRMSAFETPTHFAYLVSDGPPSETHRMLLVMAPEIRALLARMPA
jgi:anti-sigma factor (TIGR02949 family)